MSALRGTHAALTSAPSTRLFYRTPALSSLAWLHAAFALPRRTTYNRGQMPLPLALAIDMTPSMRSELRWDVAGLAIGFILLSIGLAAMGLFLFRRRSSDLTLPYFSPFTILHATR